MRGARRSSAVAFSKGAHWAPTCALTALLEVATRDTARCRRRVKHTRRPVYNTYLATINNNRDRRDRPRSGSARTLSLSQLWRSFQETCDRRNFAVSRERRSQVSSSEAPAISTRFSWNFTSIGSPTEIREGGKGNGGRSYRFHSARYDGLPPLAKLLAVRGSRRLRVKCGLLGVFDCSTLEKTKDLRGGGGGGRLGRLRIASSLSSK